MGPRATAGGATTAAFSFSRVGSRWAATSPIKAAHSTTAGNGALNTNRAAKAAPAITSFSGAFRARFATRSKASHTIARTAAFTPSKAADTGPRLAA